MDILCLEAVYLAWWRGQQGRLAQCFTADAQLDHIANNQLRPTLPPCLDTAVMLAKQRDQYNKDFLPILIELPCTLLSVATATLPAASVVATNFRFSPAVVALARKVVGHIRQEYGAGSAFNGIHLRIEKDASDWMAILGGKESYWGLYLTEVRCCCACLECLRDFGAMVRKPWQGSLSCHTDTKWTTGDMHRGTTLSCRRSQSFV